MSDRDALVQVSVDLPDLKDIERKLGSLSDRAPEALAKGINASFAPINKYITKLVSARYTYKPKGLKDAKVFRANGRKLGGAIIFKGTHVPLDRFKYNPGTHGARENRYGYYNDKLGQIFTEARGMALTVQVRKDKPPAPLPGAFEIDLHGKKIFRRNPTSLGISDKISARLASHGIVATKSNAVGVSRMFSLDVPQMVDARAIQPEIQSFATQTLGQQVDKAIARIIKEAETK